MNKQLNKCPCGQVPNALLIDEGSTLKWAWAYGSCCNDWAVEFRTDNYTPDSSESMENAIRVWSAANREEG